MRRIVANLFCEGELGPEPNRTSAPRSVLVTVSRLATLLRVFAREGDRLWLPAPVNPESVPDMPGLPRPVFETGPLRELPTADEVLAWCETPAAAAHRGGARESAAVQLDDPLYEVLWRLPTPEPSVVAAVHHRAFHLRIAEEIGRALLGARMVESLSELDRILQHGPQRWIVKAPLSAAGRERYIERNDTALSDPKARRTVERLLARHGTLLFEPWMDRVADFGVSALVTHTAMRIVGIHHQRIDARGRFVGIDLVADLSAEERGRLVETTETVADSLRRAGYVGPFGIDAWRYRREDGAVVLHPLGEINARMTFGLVAWTLAERVPGTQLL